MAEAEGNVALEELVVTARKREESLIDVPISMTAVTGEAMALANRRSVTDIATSVPGLNINTDSIGRAFISIRGIGTALQAGVQPGVGLFQDGIYVPYTSFANNPTLDIARIEVLRGPQGTLYGKNTLGGAINVITREPSDVFEGSVYATGSSEDESMEGGGRISGPLGDKFKARLAASTRNSNGFFEHDLIEGDVAPIDSTQVNGTLQFDATEDLTLALNGYWQEIEGGGAYSAVNDEKDYRSNVQINVLNRTEFRYEGVNAKADFALPSANTNDDLHRRLRQPRHGWRQRRRFPAVRRRAVERGWTRQDDVRRDALRYAVERWLLDARRRVRQQRGRRGDHGAASTGKQVKSRDE